MARQRVETYGPDGALLRAEEVEVGDAPPSLEKELAALRAEVTRHGQTSPVVDGPAIRAAGDTARSANSVASLRSAVLAILAAIHVPE